MRLTPAACIPVPTGVGGGYALRIPERWRGPRRRRHPRAPHLRALHASHLEVTAQIQEYFPLSACSPHSDAKSSCLTDFCVRRQHNSGNLWTAAVGALLTLRSSSRTFVWMGVFFPSFLSLPLPLHSFLLQCTISSSKAPLPTTRSCQAANAAAAAVAALRYF